MKEQEINRLQHEIHDLLSGRRLKESLMLLSQLVRASGRSEWILEQEQLNTTYRLMLQYTVGGSKDPERQKVYRKLVTDTYELADRSTGFLLEALSTGYINIRKRVFRDDPGLEPFIDGCLAGKDRLRAGDTDYLQNLTRIFHIFWLSDRLSDRDLLLAEKLRDSSRLPAEVKSLLVTSLNLGLLRVFDERKFSLLFSFFDLESEELRQRALIGLLLAFYKYDRRMVWYPAISSRLVVLDEDPAFKMSVQEVVLQLLRSKRTEELTRKMQTEILPEMIKLSPQVRARLDLDKLLSDSLSDDKNPEWEKLLDGAPGLKDQMEKLSEMQMAGDDVFMSSFAMLKGFPFFQHLINWFFPFTREHPELKSMEASGSPGQHENLNFSSFLDSVQQSFYLCNSDKFSICFGIKTMPPEMQQFLSDGLRAEAEQLKEILADDILLDPMHEARRVIRQYTQDLYRFFRLHPDRTGFDDPFSWSFDFHRKAFFSDLFSGDTRTLFTLGEFYLGRNAYHEAAEVYEVLEAAGEQGSDLLQKMAWSQQKLGNYPKALEYYLKADLTLPENVWNLKKIGLCYRYLKQPEKALQYYRQAELFDPEDLNTEVSIGHCLLDLQEFEEALRSYFKVEYLAPDNQKVWRPIAWCSLILGKFDQAEKYYLKLIEKGPNRYDLVNYGHLSWCQGNRTRALEFYRGSIMRFESSIGDFITLFEHDREHLIRLGVNADEIPIMLDQLRYQLE